MAAILDSGFEDPAPPAAFRSHPHPHPPSLPGSNSQKYVSSPLNRAPVSQPMNSRPEYFALNSHDPSTPPPIMPHSADSISSSIESRAGGGHAKKRSGGAGRDRYGPLGPLADDDTGWGAAAGNASRQQNGHGNGYANGNGNGVAYGRKI